MPISSLISLFVFYFSGKAEKLVALLVYSSFRRVTTSGIRNSSAATSSISWIRQAVLKWRVNTESLPIHHNNATRPSQNCINEVTRLVATEHVRKNYSLREQFYCKYSVITGLFRNGSIQRHTKPFSQNLLFSFVSHFSYDIIILYLNKFK